MSKRRNLQRASLIASRYLYRRCSGCVSKKACSSAKPAEDR
jgi:hypothetical protein